MLAARSSKTVVKVLAVMMMVLSVLFSGCANKEDEWKKACQEFENRWGTIALIDAETQKDESKHLRNGENEALYNDSLRRFYRLKDVVPDTEDSLQKVEKIAKESEKKEWIGRATAWRAMFEKEKRKQLHYVEPKPGFKGRAPKEDWNWNKEVVRKDIREKALKGKVDTKMDKEHRYNRDFTAPADENAPWKETSKKNDSKSQKAETAETVKSDKTGVVTGKEVRMRDAGNLNSSVLGYFDKGEKVAILESKNGWYKVRRANGKEGWVSADFCKAQ